MATDVVKLVLVKRRVLVLNYCISFVLKQLPVRWKPFQFNAKSLFQALLFAWYIWLVPIEIIIVTVLLLREFGIYFLAGLAAATVIGVTQMMLGHMIGKLRQVISLA